MKIPYKKDPNNNNCYTLCPIDNRTFVGSFWCHICPFFGKDHGSFVECSGVPVPSHMEEWMDTEEGKEIYKDIPGTPVTSEEDSEAWAQLACWYMEHEKDIFEAGYQEGIRALCKVLGITEKT